MCNICTPKVIGFRCENCHRLSPNHGGNNLTLLFNTTNNSQKKQAAIIMRLTKKSQNDSLSLAYRFRNRTLHIRRVICLLRNRYILRLTSREPFRRETPAQSLINILSAQMSKNIIVSILRITIHHIRIHNYPPRYRNLLFRMAAVWIIPVIRLHYLVLMLCLTCMLHVD